jgi:exopolyphosphatase/guanosine-5'-triphosphate,3'-diphosphate pyrophosphatase
MWSRHHASVAVGVVDVGSNTVRLVVSRGGQPLLGLRESLGLGAAIEQYGTIPAVKLAETADTVARFVAAARGAGAELVEVLVASPGRQAANGDDLIEALAAASRCPVRALSAAEEARLAFVGALGEVRGSSRKSVAVVDVGGGSAQVAVGTREGGPVWVRSIDIGSLRLTSRCLENDPPGAGALAAARAEVEKVLDGFVPPLPQAAYAVGGSARAVRRMVGPRLGTEELAEAISITAEVPAADLVARYGLNPNRGRTVAGGAVILAALQARLGVPFKVVRAGLREGAVAELTARLIAEAA